jgi:glycosyltransferase involved in cell wall biosynthesis
MGMPQAHEVKTPRDGPRSGPTFEAAFPRDFVVPPLVSIIVTCYNYERYIADCLRSIAGQSYGRIECIVVDDCSTDGSVSVVEDFIAGPGSAAAARESDPPRFRLVSNGINGGQMRSFLTGFRESRGAFVVFVDADDMLFPDFVETHLKAHLNRSILAGLSCSDEVLIDGGNAVVSGSIEIGLKPGSQRRWAGATVRARVSELHGWRDAWQFGEEVALAQAEAPVLYVSPTGNVLDDWLWTTTSAVMLRRGVLDLVLTQAVADVRICADFVLLPLCHLIGGSLLITSAHGCYRRHGENNFAVNAVVASGIGVGGKSRATTNRQMRARLRSEVIARFDSLSAVIGVRRALWIAATVGRGKDLLAVSRIAGERLRFGRPKFLALVAYIGARRGLHRVLRALRSS